MSSQPWVLEWCEECRAYYGYSAKFFRERESCCVAHPPEMCCHYGQMLMLIFPITRIGPEGRANEIDRESSWWLRLGKGDGR